jgi:hypothetical protein
VAGAHIERSSAYDNSLLSRAMINHDLSYLAALEGQSDRAIALCEQASPERATESIISTLGYVKLADVPQVMEFQHTHFDNEFARWMLLAASIACTRAAAHMQQGRNGRAAADSALTAAERLQGDHYMVLRARGRFHLKYGDPDLARTTFEAAKNSWNLLHHSRAAVQPGEDAMARSDIIDREIEIATSMIGSAASS